MSSIQSIGLTRKRVSALRELKSLLRSRNIERGRQLPPERELCEQLPISRGLLRLLLNDLESAGAIKRVSARQRVLIDPECEGRPTAATGGMDGIVALLGKREDAAAGDTGDGRSPGVAAGEDLGGIVAANWVIEQHATRRLIAAGFHALGVHYEKVQADEGAWLLKQRFAGLVALRGVKSSVLRQAVAMGIATVAFGELNESLGVPCVASDHRQGSAELTRRAIAAGAKHVVRVWPLAGALDLPRPWLDQRDRGYESACAAAGIAVQPAVKVPCIWRGADSEQRLSHNARTIAGYLMDHIRRHGPIDVILATNDVAAIEIAEACRVLGIDPQRDVAVCGYDNNYQDCHYRPYSDFIPALTVDRRNEVVGQTLVDVLLSSQQGETGDQSPPKVTLVQPEVIEPPGSGGLRCCDGNCR